eukprot:Skav227685  [mRNA]  locus=scaffold2108:149625:149906:- [translate_table: standard]
MARRPERILQLDFLHEGDAMILRCVGMDGEEVMRLRATGFDLVANVLKHFSCKLQVCSERHRVVLPDGQLLDAVCSADPFATIATVRLEHDKL